MEIPDIKLFKETYETSSLPEKRIIVLELLETLRKKWQIFEDFFGYITRYPEEVTDSDLGQVFGVILQAIYHNSQEKVSEIAARLQSVKDSIQKMKEKEQEEKSKENPHAILTQQFTDF